MRGPSGSLALHPRSKTGRAQDPPRKIRNLGAEGTSIPPGGPEPNDVRSLTYIREGKISIRSLPDILTVTVRLRLPVRQTWLPQIQPQRRLPPQSGGCLTRPPAPLALLGDRRDSHSSLPLPVGSRVER